MYKYKHNKAMWQDEHLENADDLSLDSNNRQKVNDLVKDKRRHKVRRVNHENRLKTIEIFGSGPQDSTIRNAVSGFRYEGHKVGSLNEDLYFKVRLATGEVGEGVEGPTLYYDDPEQYENHLFEEVSREIKETWHKKFLTAKYGLSSS